MAGQSSIAAGAAGFVIIMLSPGALQADENSADRDFMSAWTGASASAESQYAYAGAAYAFANDLDADGFLVRIGLGSGQYRTDGADSHLVDHYDLDLMVGYHLNVDQSAISLYAGADFKEHDNDDPDTDIRGREIGAKAQVEAYAPLTEALFISAFANYSTAFDSFNASAKLGYRVTDTVSVGPEASALGSQGFDQVRAGIASAFRVLGGAELAPAAGAAWDFDDADYGIYGSVNLYTRF